MKARISLLIALLLLSCSIANSKESVTENNPSREGTINVYASPDLYNLTTKWAMEYGSINPTLNIKVIQATDKDLPGMLRTSGGIGFISDEFSTLPDGQILWNIVIGRDIIVPVMNAKNQLADEVTSKGISAEGLAKALDKAEDQNWGLILGNSENVPFHFYMTNDGAIKKAVSDFLKIRQFQADGVTIVSGKEMINAIQKDPNALGFCKLTDLLNQSGQVLADQIKLVPIDKNGNGKIDYMENIYTNLQTFTRGVWIGKYPKVLSGHLYSVSSGKPANQQEVAFLSWVLSDGQQFLGMNGYSDLVSNERQSQMDKLNETIIQVAAPKTENYAIIKVILLSLIIIIAFGIIMNTVARRRRDKKGAESETSSTFPGVFDENSVIVPKGLYFDKTHVWAFMEKDGVVKVGIDDFLQHITGPLSRIGMKPAGVKIKKGDSLLTIMQNGKHLTLYSPVSGTISAYNEILMTNSSALNSDPYSEGWVYMIEPTNWHREIQFLTMAEKYKIWLKDEFIRFKDFLASSIQANEPEFAHIAIQDGGALKESVLADFGPEIWEDFQTKFINTAK